MEHVFISAANGRVVAGVVGTSVTETHVFAVPTPLTPPPAAATATFWYNGTVSAVVRDR